MNHTFSLSDKVLLLLIVSGSIIAFLFGNSTSRYLILLLSLCLGLVKPAFLIYAFSYSTTLEISENIITPTRLFVFFTFFSLLIRRDILKGALSKPDPMIMGLLIAFWLWSLLNALLRVDIQTLNSIVILFLFLFCSYALIKATEKAINIPFYICMGLLPTVLLCCCVMLNLITPTQSELLVTDQGMRYRGIVNDPNYLSSILLAGLGINLAFLKFRRKVIIGLIALIGTLLFFMAVWVTQSRAGIYTAFLLIAFFIIVDFFSNLTSGRFRRDSIIISFCAIVIPIIILINSEGRFVRLLENRGVEVTRGSVSQTFPAIINHPILGIGEKEYLNHHRHAPHNTILSIMLESGIIGAFLFIALVLLVFVRLVRKKCKDRYLHLFPLLGVGLMLQSFSAIGHKMFWFLLIFAAIYAQRVLTHE